MAAKIRFQELYAKAINEEESHIVPIYTELKKLGQELHYGHFRHLKCTQVGVHWRNRDEAMCCGREVLGLWDEVDRTGVAPDLWRDATCMEEHGERKSETKFIQLTANDKHLRTYTSGARSHE